MLIDVRFFTPYYGTPSRLTIGDSLNMVEYVAESEWARDIVTHIVATLCRSFLP